MKKNIPLLIALTSAILFFPFSTFISHPLDKHFALAAISDLAIQGRVTDSQGNGLYGVTIIATYGNQLFLPLVVFEESEVHSLLPAIYQPVNPHSAYWEKIASPTMPPAFQLSATTDANGYFVFNDLTITSYKLTPLGAGFTPSERVAIVPDDSNNQDFILDASIPENMVYVAEGEFWMGCDEAHNGGDVCFTDELPLHPVYLDAFFIDKFEVTNARYTQ